MLAPMEGPFSNVTKSSSDVTHLHLIRRASKAIMGEYSFLVQGEPASLQG